MCGGGGGGGVVGRMGGELGRALGSEKDGLQLRHNLLEIYIFLNLVYILNRDWHTSASFVYPALHLNVLVTFIVINSEPRQLATY